jgi:hypothetical protein
MTAIGQIFLISAVFTTAVLTAASAQLVPLSAGQLGGISAVAGGNGNGNGNNGNNNGNGNSGNNNGNGNNGNNQGNGNAGSNQGNRSSETAPGNDPQTGVVQLNGVVTPLNGSLTMGQYRGVDLSGYTGNFPGAALQGFIYIPNNGSAAPR